MLGAFGGFRTLNETRYPPGTRIPPAEALLEAKRWLKELTFEQARELSKVKIEPTGRISYQGTTWPAVSPEGEIPAGGQARIISRHNIMWIVEPVD